MNLHLCINASFVELFIKQASELQQTEKNYYAVYGSGEMGFTSFDYPEIKKVARLKEDPEIATFVKNAANIYIHFLTDEVIHFLNLFDLGKKKIIWVFWGADGFAIKAIRTHIPVPYPSAVLYSSFIKDKLFSPRRIHKEIFLKEKITHFAHYIRQDFLLMRRLLRKDTRFINFSYGFAEKIIKDNEVTGNDILIGNSASKANLHEHIIRELMPKDLAVNVHCPLSYGGPREYAEKVAELGRKVLKENFHVYLDVLPTDKYYEVLGCCSSAIMWQNRSQAWGNIMQLLFQGTKVFMHPNSNLFRYLSSSGFYVCPLKRRLKAKDLTPVSQEMIDQNRKKLFQLFGKEQTAKNFRELLNPQ
jgi:hypothetical protein